MKIHLISFSKRNFGLRQISSYLKQNKFDVNFMIVDHDKADLFDVSVFGPDDLIGMSVVTDYFPKARRLSERIRERFSRGRPIIIFGGPHATIQPGACLKFCDYAVKGEAEETMLEICSNPRSIRAIRGVCYLNDGRLVENPPAELVQDLDKYPLPDNAGLKDLSDYNIMASRGCPYSCSYCYNNYLKNLYRAGGPYLRQRGRAGIIAELKAARDLSPGLKSVSFFDDTLLARSLEDLAELFGHYKSEIGLPFYCLASPTQFTEEKLRILAAAGLSRIQIGIQTGSESVNRTIYKRFCPNDRLIECAQLCKKYGIEVYFDVIFNNPYETEEDVRKTLDLILELPQTWRQIHLQGWNLIFYPGSDITDSAVRDGYISPKREGFKGVQTTQWVVNSPLFFNSSLDNPLWDINFNSKTKDHYNTLIALTPYLPKSAIKFLIGRRLTVKVISIPLKAFIWMITKTVLREDNTVMRFFRSLRVL